MQPRRIFTPLGQYLPGIWNGQNESGIRPVGDRVLILPDQPPEYSRGGIAFTPKQRERDHEGAETGILAAIGPEAFKWNSDRSRLWEGDKPKVGDRVYFERYAGQSFTGADNQMYRIMDDKCIGGTAVSINGDETAVAGAFEVPAPEYKTVQLRGVGQIHD